MQSANGWHGTSKFKLALQEEALNGCPFGESFRECREMKARSPQLAAMPLLIDQLEHPPSTRSLTGGHSHHAASVESVGRGPVSAQSAVEDREFGYYADRLISTRTPLVLDPELERRLAEVGNRVAQALPPDSTGTRPTEFVFRIVNDEIINAYAAAGGHVYITTGMMDILESEDELAAVHGHEIAHTANSHQLRALYDAHAKARKGKFAGVAIGAVLGFAAAYAAPAGSPFPVKDSRPVFPPGSANPVLLGHICYGVSRALGL